MDKNSEYIYVEVDYKGNIYIRFLGVLYNVLFDMSQDNGFTLNRLSQNTVTELKETFLDNSHLQKYVKKGDIHLSDITLKGRVTQIIKNMDPEEYSEHSEQNNFTSFDSTYDEANFFRIQKHKKIYSDSNSDSELESDSDSDLDNYLDFASTDNEYIFCDIKYRDNVIDDKSSVDYKNNAEISIHPYIIFSDMLNCYSAYNDTLMIKGNEESKIVTSCIQSLNGFCSCRIIFFSNNIIKIQYPNSFTVYSKFIFDGESLKLHKIKKVKDTGLLFDNIAD
jgi:hypothetical protein